MGYDKAYFRDYRRKQREIEKQLTRRYHSWEQMPGESYSDFKKRLTGKTLPLDK